VITIEAGLSDSACGGAEVQLATTPGNGFAGVLVRAGEAGAVGLAVFATAVEEAPVAATVPGVAQAETVRASPASAQAANVLCGDSEVFMSSTTDGARGGLRRVPHPVPVDGARKRGINTLRRSVGVLTMDYVNTRKWRASQNRRMRESYLYSLLEADLNLVEVPV
jgi:hypothetical protein